MEVAGIRWSFVGNFFNVARANLEGGIFNDSMWEISKAAGGYLQAELGSSRQSSTYVNFLGSRWSSAGGISKDGNLEVCRWNSVGKISNVAGGNLEGRWWILHDGIRNVAGRVMQVGIFKLFILAFLR